MMVMMTMMILHYRFMQILTHSSCGFGNITNNQWIKLMALCVLENSISALIQSDCQDLSFPLIEGNA
jgi:hypothetical protein